MKPSLIAGLILLGGLAFLSQNTLAQTVVFRESMGIMASGTSISIAAHEANDGFDADSLTMTFGNAAYSASISGTYPSSGYDGSSGSANVSFPKASVEYGFAIEGIDASDLADLSVQFGYYKALSDQLPNLSFSYFNGVEYVDIPFQFNELPTALNFRWYLSPVISLPEEAQINGLKLRWIKAGSVACRIDDVVLMKNTPSTDPVLAVNPAALIDLNAISGEGPSAPQSFTLSGTNLDCSDVSIIPPPGFEVSESGSGTYSAALTLPSFDGTETEIWVRLAGGLEAGFYSGQVTVSGGNAADVFIQVSGTVCGSFDVPYFNGFRTSWDYTVAESQDFEFVQAQYSPDNGGCIKIFYTGLINTPDIILAPHSHLNVSFQASAPVSSHDLEITCMIIYEDDFSGPSFLVAEIEGTNVFQTYYQTVNINNTDYLRAKIQFGMTSEYLSFVNFRDLSIRDLSDWTGLADPDWNNPGNWTGGVPGSKSETLVPLTENNPVISGEGSAGDLVLGENTTLTINPGGKLSVGRTLTNPNGPAGLIIEDGGSLILPAAGVSATVKRSFAAADWGDCTDGWNLISSPVENQPIEGGWTPTGIGNDYDFYAWSEPLELWLNQKETANNLIRFVPGQGYLVAYQQGGTKTFAGPLNSGDVTRTLTRTPGNDCSGWNLLGNPFPAALLWNHSSGIWGDLQGLNINAYARLWDRGAKSYSIVSPGEIIPATSGFMVELTDGAEQLLTLPAAARTHGNSSPVKTGNDPRIRLAAIEQDDGSAQECILLLNPSAPLDYDPYLDASFFPGYAPLFYSLKGDQPLSLSGFPEFQQDQVIPLGFEKNDERQFRIALRENTTSQSLFLYDRKLAVEHSLDAGHPYAFTSEAGDDFRRFDLRFQPVTTALQDIPAGKAPVVIFIRDRVLHIDFPAEARGRSLELFDLSGRRVLSQNLPDGCCHAIPLDLRAGFYLARISGRTGTLSEKIFLN